MFSGLNFSKEKASGVMFHDPLLTSTLGVTYLSVTSRNLLTRAIEMMRMFDVFISY
ncbi:hypothetical protein Plhal304r1_c005g0021341 [Plasmopara halstedii]